MNNKYSKLLTIPLSNIDIMKSLGKSCRIIEYSELEEYSNIEDLLSKPKDYVIILIETVEQNIGHWICLLRYQNTIEFFNSYGKPIDSQKNTLISPEKNKEFGQTRNYLSNLLYNSNYKIVYNKKQLQSFDNLSETCGRWVINRIECHMDRNLSLQQYIKYLEYLKAYCKIKSFDLLICELVPI